ncbi:L-ribulose-5-phosphate 4-epimerase AraD [Perlabentimonas gracilis]|uniref:L-ribulose-5-phosphate 4-epimerase AraD n=1 Tax=Perlabentimonas gracilis TaxID=2715279 RepID=UPI00140AED5F|nr:L-ribulose-5-phosphate 4-epimerase AraD [Perlabentimonas gracilis]NHB69497.1 L-ribulose-5-phosphate 4-epimerase AraD [Perlabentimonas gracilis]
MLFNLRKSVLEANLMLKEYGLVVFTWGNVSAIDRSTGLVAIKPSGVEYEHMKVDDIVVVDLDGNRVFGELNPSSDTATHLELYSKFPNIGGIVHTHSPWATSRAQAGKSIPTYGTTHADHFYGEIPCTRPMNADETQNDYEKNTGHVIVERFESIDPKTMPAVLVHGHGPFTWGNDGKDAVYNAVVLEEVAKMAFHTELLGNETPIDQHLIDRHFLRKHGKDAYYGQKK